MLSSRPLVALQPPAIAATSRRPQQHDVRIGRKTRNSSPELPEGFVGLFTCRIISRLLVPSCTIFIHQHLCKPHVRVPRRRDPPVDFMRILFNSTPRRPTYSNIDVRGSVEKPLFRGLLHAFAAVAIPFTPCFSTLPAAAPNAARVAFYTFVASCFLCYTVSAIYHLGSFSRRVFSWLQCVDQAFIFLLTAGSYTPSVLMAPDTLRGCVFLLVVWSFAIVGAWHVVAHNRLSWFVVSAASAVPFMVTWVLPHASRLQMAFALAGWTSYAVGFVSYVTMRPRLIPTVFGYHEVFHVFVVIAGVCTAFFNQQVVHYYMANMQLLPS